MTPVTAPTGVTVAAAAAAVAAAGGAAAVPVLALVLALVLMLVLALVFAFVLVRLVAVLVFVLVFVLVPVFVVVFVVAVFGLNHPAVGHNDTLQLGRAVVFICIHVSNAGNHIHAVLYLSKDHMLAVEFRARPQRDKKLRVVGVGTGVGHGQQVRLGVVVDERLVVKLVPIDGSAARAVPGSEVAPLDHEARDDAVELERGGDCFGVRKEEAPGNEGMGE